MFRKCEMKQSRYVDVPESCLRDSLAEAKEHRELELMHYSYCFMKLLSSQLFTIASQQILVICWVQISGFYCWWATAESTLSRNLPLSWEFHDLGGWHSEESRQAGGRRRLPASISASPHLTAALSFSSSVLFRNLRILKTAGCIPWERWGPIVILISCSSSFLEVLSTLLAELSEERTV